MSASWPNNNFGVQNRMFNSVSRDGGNEPVPMAIPRFKFTWFADIVLSGAAAITNLGELGLKQGHLYTHLKGVDHPKPTFKTETLNSYNRRYKLQTKMEMPAFTMTFHDDTTGFALALQKELINHANWVGGMGGVSGNLTQNVHHGLNQYNMGNSGVSSFIQPDRVEVESRPSLGMKLLSCSRTWISHIIIYDLGTEPSSINVYVYQNPFLTGVEHSALDTYDRTGFGEMTFSFEYENFFSMVGQSQRNVREFVDGILFTTSEETRDSTIHAKMGSFDAARDWYEKCLAQCSTPVAEKSATGQSLEEMLNVLHPDAAAMLNPKPVNWEQGGATDPEMSTAEAIRRGLLTAPYSGIPVPALEDQETSYRFLDDRYNRAVANYTKEYGNLVVDTPQAAIRREEILSLGQARNEAAARYEKEKIDMSTIDTKSATLNTRTQYGVVQASPIPGRSVPVNTAPTLATLQGLTRTPNPPAMSTPTYTIADPAVPFSKYNQDFLRTFKAGVTK